MNRIYKVIWSKVKNQYVVVSELAHSNGKQSSKSEHISVGGSLRTLAAALMIGGSLLFMPYTASAADSYQLQNGEGVITVDGNNLNDFFMEAVQNEDGSYTIIFEDGTSAAVAEENLYNVGDRLGAFVTTNEDGTKAVYTDDVLDENSTKVVPAKNHVVTNEEGFYVNNGKGTYNTLNKDGLWVGGTNDEEGLHVDDKGNIETTGSANINKGITTGNVNINTNEQNTVTGLSNTEWKPAEAVANRAATEGQLSTIQESVDNLNNNAVLYDGTDKSSVTFGGTSSNTPVQLKNVADGTDENDAVNFGQLSETNTNVTNLTNTVEQNTTNIETNTTNISSLQTDVNAGWKAQVNGTDVKTVNPDNNSLNFVSGDNVTVSNENGNIKVSADLSNLSVEDTNAVLYDGTDKSSVTFGGTSSNTPVQLKNVADGTDENDAVNFGQLSETNTNVTNLTNTVEQNTTNIETNTTNISSLQTDVNAGWKAQVNGTDVKTVNPDNNSLNFVSGDNVTVSNDNGNIKVSADLSNLSVDKTNAVLYDGTDKSSVTLGGTGSDTPVQLKNVADGTDENDAVNFGQLSETNTNVTNLTNTVNQNTTNIATNTTNISNLQTDVDAGWTAKVGTTEIKVTPESNELTFVGDGNVNVTAANTTITVGLADTITIGSSGGTNNPIAIDGTKGEITGLSNIDWKTDDISQTSYETSNKAATEAQLKDVYDAIGDAQGTTYTAGNGLNSLNGGTEFSVKAGQGITVDSNGVAVNAGKGLGFSDDQNKQLEVKVNGDNLTVGDNGISLADDITINKVTTTDGFYVNGGGQFTSAGLTTQNVSGLTNIKWDEETIAAVKADTAGTGAASYAATQGQLNTVYEAAIADAEGTTYEAGNGVKIDDSTSGTADKKISIDEGKGLTFDAVDGNKLAVNTGDGLEIVDDKVKVDIDGSNLTLNENGLSLSTTLTGLTSVTADNFKVGDKTYISNTGINANGQKITGLTTADNIYKDSTDAVSGAEIYDIQQKVNNIKTYEDGDGISIGGDNNTISVNAGNGIEVTDDKVTVNNGKGLAFDTTDDNSLMVATGKGLEFDTDNTVKVKVGKGLKIDEDNDNAVAIDLSENSNLVADSEGLRLATNLTGLGDITANGTITAGSFSTENGSITAGDIVINDNGKITGLMAGTDPNDAVTVQQLENKINSDAVTYTANTNKTQVYLQGQGGTTITNVKAGNIYTADSTDAVNGGQLYATNQIVGNGVYTSTNLLSDENTTEKIEMNLTGAVSTLDEAIGDLDVSSRLPSFFAGEEGQPVILDDVTTGLKEIGEAIGPMSGVWDGTSFLKTQSNLSGAAFTLDRNLSLTLQAIGVEMVDDGQGGQIASTTINWSRDGAFNYIPDGTGSVVSGMRLLDSAIKTNYDNLDARVTTLEGIHNITDDVGTQSLTKAVKTFAAMSTSQMSTLNALSNLDTSTVDTLSSISPKALKAVAATADNIGGEPIPDSAVNAEPATNDSPRLPEDPNTINGDHIVNGELSVKDDAIFDKDVSVGGKLDVTGEANFHSNATFDKDVSIGGTLNMNGNKITGVADGDVSADSTDAINGSQLYAVEQKVDNNSQAINAVGNQVNRLSNRIDKVGAGAAALAALHPLDFDPDDKLSFAAGYGNYAGENAVAVGAFYQPNEDTMFSIGGTFGNDENMVNAGVSFKLGQKSNVSRSRVSMAKELVALRDEVAQLKALMAHSGVLPQGKLDTSALFPDVPENHWAYEYVHELGKLGILEGTESGNYEGDRMMTRYEMAAIVYRAMQKGVNVDSRMLNEFAPELKLIRVDVVARDDNGNPTIERVRVNDTQQA